MGNASQINRSRDSVRVERRSDLNESDLGEVYCILTGLKVSCVLFCVVCSLKSFVFVSFLGFFLSDVS